MITGPSIIPIETVQFTSDRHRAYAVSFIGVCPLIEAVHDAVEIPDAGLFSKTV